MPRRDPPTESSAPTTPLLEDATVRAHLQLGDSGRPVSLLPVNPAIAPAAGDFDSRYRAKGTLGEGGMGEVRLCHDQQIGRDVAVKVVRPEMLRRADSVARFVREARVQGQLEHPAIVPVHDLGVTPDGAAYFTMKRVRGVTLSEIVRRLDDGDPDTTARFSLRKLIQALVSVSLAVDFAHKRGVLHRDLKPSNVMIGDFGEVYVLDWGIAKVGADDEPAPSLGDDETQIDDPVTLATRAGDVLGTPGYMAPEQVEGRALDPRSDVYALGAILFEVLAREPLHQGTVAQVLASTVSGNVRRPSQVRPDLEIPPELDAICVKATARRRDARYATARHVSDALEAFLEGDRDVEQRREMAATHARRAEEALGRGLADTDAFEAAQIETMRELGRALALDPTHAHARDVLRRALLDVPTRHPAPVVEAMRRRDHTTLRLGARLGSYQLALYFAFAPILYAMGLEDWRPAMFPAACLAAGLVATLIGLRRRTIPEWVQYVTLVGMVAAMAALSRIFSPLVLVPTLLATNAAVLQIHPWRRMRNLVLGLCLAASVAPIGLELVGVLEPTFWFEGNRIVIATPGAFRPLPTILFFVLATGTLIASPALFIGAIRRALSAAILREELAAWRARLLAPEAALEPAVATPRPQRGAARPGAKAVR